MPPKPKPRVRISTAADPAFVQALGEIAARIAATLKGADRAQLPVKMFLAGGAAVHLYTGARSTGDVDAVFSKRLLPPEDLDVNYVDAKGDVRLLYFDRQYNDTFGLMHELAYEDSLPVVIADVDAKLLEVRLLHPVDLAVSRLAGFDERDRCDIESLARASLITAEGVRIRAEEALSGCVGNVERLRVSIDLADQLIARSRPRK